MSAAADSTIRSPAGWAVVAIVCLLLPLLGCEELAVESTVHNAAGVEPEVTAEVVEETERSRKYALTLSQDDLSVDMYLREPSAEAPDQKRTGVLLLAGFETGRQALDLIAERDDLVLASIDYPGHGLRDLYALETEDDALRKLRMIGADTLRAATWATSCLDNRADVDKVVVLGVSFGSVFATALAAYDQRVDGLVLVYGGGNLPAVVNANVDKGALPWWLPRFAFLSAVRVALGDLEPMRHISQLSPRPLIMVSSPRDRYFPAETAKQLLSAAKEPKEIHWHETEHMDLFDQAVLLDVTALVVERLQANGLMPPQ